MGLLQYLKGIGLIFLGVILIVIGYMLAIDAMFKTNDIQGWFSVCLIIVGFILPIIGGYIVKTSVYKPIKIESPVKVEIEKVKVVICPKCKTENDVDSDFCKKCGNKLK